MRRFGERDYVMETAITGDLALVRADTADRYGNLIFRYAQMNFGPVMATAAKLAVAEVRTITDDPLPHERVQLPGIYVDRVVAVMSALNRLQIAWRAAQDIDDGLLVNLGIGLPVHCSDYLRPEVDVFLQSENGVVGVGPLAAPEKADTDLVDAGSRRITLRPGASIIDSLWSFAMIRGGHIDVTILGAFEVAANGDLANWDMRVANRGPLVGGAMDLAACAREVWVIMEHVTRKGAPRLLERCTLPLTAVRCVTRVYTDLAVVDVTPRLRGARDRRRQPDELQEKDRRAATFAPDCKVLTAPAICGANSHPSSRRTAFRCVTPSRAPAGPLC